MKTAAAKISLGETNGGRMSVDLFGVAARVNSRQDAAVKFNKFVWDLYNKSERGKKAIRRFSRLTSQFIEDWERNYPYEFFDEYKDQYPVPRFSIDIPRMFCGAVSGMDFKNLKEANRHYKTLTRKNVPFEMANKKGKKEVVWEFPEEEGDWYDYVAGITLGLHQGQPDLFLPYNFREKFNQLEEIHTEFGIPLPPIPGKHDKVGRGLYYISINQAWQEFRLLHGLSPVEMCAFLYDFAPQFTTPLDAGDLPTPSRVWLVTGGSWDIDFVDKASAATVRTWGGNSVVRRGEILMAYLVAPRRCIDSIWRACSDGFIDPFSHYHSNVTLCGRIKTAPVTYAELKEDSLLGQKSAVRAHFQGPSSKAAFTLEEYEAILKIMKGKGQDISLLPRIPVSNYLPSVELLYERDVEEHLIEPFLKRLGFKKGDWVRQMPVRMGRGERNYPDYAVGANTKRGEESAKMLLESKYQLSAHSEFNEAFDQTKSYAFRLQSKIMAMAAREGIWVFPPDNGNFDIKKFVHKGWGELNHPDHFHEILQLIGRDKVWR
jgi:hypothetical protein